MTSNKSYQQFLLPLIIIIVGGGFGAYAALQQKTPASSVLSSDEPANVKVSADDDPVIGDKNAPVTIIEFSDFQCPFCGNFHKETWPALKSQYIDTGKAKLVYRDFPLGQHTFAQKAAEAADCVNEQGKFWQMHDILFDHQDALTVADLKKYAGTLGLNMNTFTTCLDSGKNATEVKKDYDDGLAVDVKSTPTFFINGQMVRGAKPLTVFEQVIEDALQKKR